MPHEPNEAIRERAQAIARTATCKSATVEWINGDGPTFDVDVRFYDYFEVTFAQLEAFAASFGSRDINFIFDPGEEDWSDLTPGTSASYRVRIAGWHP